MTAAQNAFAEIPGESHPSWKPLDLAGLYKEHGLEIPKATSMSRRDAHGAGYVGMVNVLFGQPEAGKTMILQGGLVLPAIIDAARTDKGKVVVWFDYEDSWQVFLNRLLALGASLDDIAAHVHYINPEGPLTVDELRRELGEVLTGDTEIVVIDSVNESMVTYALDPENMEKATRWRQIVPNTVSALAPNAAVWLIDHEPITTGKERRQAFGSQGKFAGVRGSQIRAMVLDQPHPGKAGSIALYVTKDRNGDVRANSRPSSSPMQLFGTVYFNPRPLRSANGLDMTIVEWQETGLDDAELVALVKKLLDGATEKGISKNQMRGLVRARGVERGNDAIDNAVHVVVADPFNHYEAMAKGTGVAYRPVTQEGD